MQDASRIRLISAVPGLQLALLIGESAALADDEPGPNDVVVQVLSVPLPHDEALRKDFLCDSFANKPNETKFSCVYSIVRWQDDYATFARALVRKARERSLDGDSLQQALDHILQTAGSETAYFPVAAYQSTFDGKPVWIVTVNWSTH